MNAGLVLVLVLALTGMGASAASLLSAGHCGTGFNHLSGPYEPTVSETVVTPFHRTDSVVGPCGQTIVHTKALPTTTVGHYGFTGSHGLVGSGFGLGGTCHGLTGTGLGLGGAGHGLTGTGYGFLSGAHGCGFPNALTGGFCGTSFGGFNNGIGSTFSGHLGGVFTSPIIGAGLGVGNGGSGILGTHFANTV